MKAKDFLKYFNYGYFLSKFEPAFLKKLLSATGEDNEITEPLKAGRSEHSREQVLTKLRSISKSAPKGKSKDKGIEPEI